MAHEALLQLAVRSLHEEDVEVVGEQMDDVAAPLLEHLSGIKDALSAQMGWHILVGNQQPRRQRVGADETTPSLQVLYIPRARLNRIARPSRGNFAGSPSSF